MRTLRIFISSPGDVAEERQIAGKVIERLQGRYWSLVRLEDVFWENEATRANAHFQDEIADPADCEIVVSILWTRLGSPLPERFRKLDGGAHATGTEWEIARSLQAAEQKIANGDDPRNATPHLLVYRRTSPRPRTGDPDLEPRAAADQAALDAYFDREFHHDDAHHTFRRSYRPYSSLLEFESLLLRHLAKLVLRHIPVLKTAFNLPPISGSPFKGLQAFDFHDSDRYFGRNREIREIQQQLLASARKGLPFILIYGGSGYGKSSLMRAGLAPVLTRPGGSLDSIHGWRRLPFQPAKGHGPLLERLVRALLLPPSPEEAAHSRDHDHWPLTGLAELDGTTIDGITWDSASLTRHLADDDKRVFAIATISQTLQSLDRHLLLEIDQLEELFTAAPFDSTQRTAFLRTLGDLSLTGRVWTIATMRSEFFPEVAKQPELFHLVGKDRGYILPPPDRQSLREIIRYPALAARLDFERRVKDLEINGEKAKHDFLHDQILADSEDNPDALPLLEFTLQQLYEERDPNHNLLTWHSYAKAGGLKGAIAKRATEVYQSLNSPALEARHRVFAALVHIDPARGTITRKRAPLAPLKLHPGTESFLQAFLDAHLLVTDEDTARNEPVITLAHEALLSHWDELSSWVKDHQGDLLARQRLAEQTQLWIDNGKKKSYLLSEARLAEAERVKESQLFTLSDNENLYLQLSKERSKRKQRLLQGAVLVFALLAAGAAYAGWMAEKRKGEAIASKEEADKQRNQAEIEKENAAELNRQASRKAHGNARDSFDSRNEPRAGLAYLAEALRYDPDNRLAHEDAYNQILQLRASVHPLPVIKSLRHKEAILFASFSPDGARIVTASSDYTARIWNSKSGDPIGEPLRHEKDVTYASFSSDGSRVVTACIDDTIRLWDASTFKLIRKFTAHEKETEPPEPSLIRIAEPNPYRDRNEWH